MDEIPLEPLTNDFLENTYGPCAIGRYQRKETVIYRDPGDMSGQELAGKVVWIVPGPTYIILRGGSVFNYIPEENITNVVRELSPVG